MDTITPDLMPRPTRQVGFRVSAEERALLEEQAISLGSGPCLVARAAFRRGLNQLIAEQQEAARRSRQRAAKG